jgi:hypothetical protein
VWHDVVVAKRWHNRNHIVIGTSPVLVRDAKYLPELVNQELILRYDLLLGTSVFLIVVVSRRVAGPDDKVDVVLDVVVDPSERLVDQ